MDSGLVFAVGRSSQTSGETSSKRYRHRFEENLKTEKGNITLPGEQALVDSLDRLYREYIAVAEPFLHASAPQRQAEVYLRQLRPSFDEIQRDGKRDPRPSTRRT